MNYHRICFLTSILLAVAACQPGGNDTATENTSAPEPAAERPAAAVEQAEPAREVMAETLPYAEVGEELVYGHFVFPADMLDPLPAIIVIHEWWGLNDDVKAIAELLAGEGYIVLAVDLFGGEVATTPGAARILMQQVLEDDEGARDNIRQAHEFLTSIASAPKTATLGWGLGGGWSLNAAMMFPDELDAAVIYYGQVTNDDEALRPITASLMGHFGTGDTVITSSSVEEFESALRRLYKTYEIHSYSGARHAFANASGTGYNEAHADQAWSRTLTFLDEKLNTDD